MRQVRLGAPLRCFHLVRVYKGPKSTSTPCRPPLGLPWTPSTDKDLFGVNLGRRGLLLLVSQPKTPLSSGTPLSGSLSGVLFKRLCVNHLLLNMTSLSSLNTFIILSLKPSLSPTPGSSQRQFLLPIFFLNVGLSICVVRTCCFKILVGRTSFIRPT